LLSNRYLMYHWFFSSFVLGVNMLASFIFTIAAVLAAWAYYNHVERFRACASVSVLT
jgi:hypothetical protein